jgi:S1-C subfamily serine protease
VALPIIDSLIEHGRVVRPLMGIEGVDVTPAKANRLSLNLEEGIIVTAITSGGPADIAGIKPGDVITRMNGIPTPDMAQFLKLLWSYEIGDVLEVEYVTNNDSRTAEVTLTERQPTG